MLPRLLLSTGEPAGIGLDISLLFAQQAQEVHVVALADPEVLAARAAQLGLKIQFDIQQQHVPSPQVAGVLKVQPLKVCVPVETGVLNPANAPYVLEMLRTAFFGCQSGEFDAVVTAPVHKGVINEAGIVFSGHTEFFAELGKVPQVVMMLATPHLRVALVTTHLPLREVSAAITAAKLTQVIRILNHDLQTKFAIAEPRILVCGLNPHAGEGGHLGREEIEVINPVLANLRAEGLHLTGCVPADTAFNPEALRRIDAVLSMYHDQGLPVLKSQGFGEAVNITLGLPIIRTSVDHGTALSLAGTGKASADSLRCAIAMAAEMVRRTRNSFQAS